MTKKSSAICNKKNLNVSYKLRINKKNRHLCKCYGQDIGLGAKCKIEFSCIQLKRMHGYI